MEHDSLISLRGKGGLYWVMMESIISYIARARVPYQKMLYFVFLEQTDLKYYTETCIKIKIVKSFSVLIRTYIKVDYQRRIQKIRNGGGAQRGGGALDRIRY